MKKLYIVFLILLMTSSCSLFNKNKTEYYKPDTSQKTYANWDNMIGRWYGESKIENGDTRKFIDERKDDGTYFIEFHTIDNKTGEVSVQKEYGEWGISGNVYFTIVKSIEKDENKEILDSSDPYTRDAYKIIKFTGTTFIYKHLEYGDKYLVKKVDSNFTFSK